MKRRKVPQMPPLPEDPQERYELFTETVLTFLQEMLIELGYERFRLVMMLDVPHEDGVSALSSTMAAGNFADAGDSFEFVMAHATALAEASGIQMFATRGTGPPIRGEG